MIFAGQYINRKKPHLPTGFWSAGAVMYIGLEGDLLGQCLFGFRHIPFNQRAHTILVF